MYTEEVRELAKARQELADLERKTDELEQEMYKAFPAFQETLTAFMAAKVNAKALEDKLRRKIGTRYECMGEEPDHPALGLRQYAEAEYDEQRAIGLCITHDLRSLLALDKKAFEKVAPVLFPGFGDWEHKRVVGTIKNDLSQWVGDDGEDAGTDGA